MLRSLDIYIYNVLSNKNRIMNRKGSRLGHDSLVDGMLRDGLWDVYNDYGMGMCAELCADQHSITREEQVTHNLLVLSSLFLQDMT